MAYKAFISSTSRDLKPQREYVAQQLRDAGIVVDPMENWPADSENPATLSAKRLAGCQFCIGLIAFHRGTIAVHDPQQRSITQIEIDEARKRGVQLLIFLLRDSEKNRAAIPVAFNQLDDDHVQRWRRSFESEFTCSYFDIGNRVDEMPNVLPSITRQLTEWEKTKRRRWRFVALLLFGAAVLFSALFYSSSNLQARLISQCLAIHDPVAFNHSTNGRYHVARLIDGRADLRVSTDFRQELIASKDVFCLLANGFPTFREFEDEFARMASRGVEIRIIMTDFSQANRPNWAGFASAVGLTNLEADAGVAVNIYDLIYALQKRFPGNVELRLNSKPLLYTMWIRDPNRPSALANLGIHYYGGQKDWPYFRITKTLGGNQIESMAQQFDRIWEMSTPYSPITFNRPDKN